MAQRRFHYDHAFEQYMRDQAIAYVAVDEAKRALTRSAQTPPRSLKSFDFVVYSETHLNLLVDVKGRKHTGRSSRSLDNWVTQGDIDSMAKWEQLFGYGFEAAFVFLYWCEAQPPDALFQETFECGGRYYAVLGIRLKDYREHMRQRSPRWQTVSLPAKDFHKLAKPLRDFL